MLAGNQESAVLFYLESLKRATGPWTYFGAAKMIAVAKAESGNQVGALKDLESIMPIARLAAKTGRWETVPDLLNEIALRYLALGRFLDARSASERFLGFPRSNAFPEWFRTHQEACSAISERSKIGISIPLDTAIIRRSLSLAQNRHKGGWSNTEDTRSRHAKINEAFAILSRPKFTMTESDAKAFIRALGATPVEMARGALIAVEQRVSEEAIDKAFGYLPGYSG
jgi:hypothetical protein